MPAQGVHSSPGTKSTAPLPYADELITSITVLLKGEQVEIIDVVLAVHSSHAAVLYASFLYNSTEVMAAEVLSILALVGFQLGIIGLK